MPTAEYMANRRAERHAYAIAKLGGCCATCGSADELEFDHVDPQTKAMDVSEMLAHSFARLDVELAKCQLLCRPCHIEKTRSEGEFGGGHNKLTPEHGTQVMYAAPNNCRCAACRTWKHEYRHGRVNARGLPC